MRRRLPRGFLLTVLAALLLALVFPSAFPAPAGAQSGDRPHIQVEPDGVILEWRTAQIEFQRQGDGAYAITLPGYRLLDQPGLSQVPVAAALLAVPPGMEPTLELLDITQSTTSLPGSLARGRLPLGFNGVQPVEAQAGEEMANIVPHRQANRPVVLERLGVSRGLNLARVVFYPALPVEDGLLQTTRVRLAVRFRPDGRASAAPLGQPEPLDAFQRLIQERVVNPEHAIPSTSFESGSDTVAPDATLADEQGLAVEIERAGLYALPYETLLQAGFPVSDVDPQTLSLSRSGEPVAYTWEGDADAVFEPGERLVFYAEPRFSRWTRYDVYFLSAGAAPGLSILERPAVSENLPPGALWAEELAEQNNIYTPDCYCGPLPEGRDQDRWVWVEFKHQPGGAVVFTHTMTATQVVASQPGLLHAWWIGGTDPPDDPDHRIEVLWNGVSLGQVEWDGMQAFDHQFTIPPGDLVSGPNTLQLAMPGLPGVRVESAWLDALLLRYATGGLVGSAPPGGNPLSGEATPSAYTLTVPSVPAWRVYDVSEPDRPVLLSDATAAPGLLTWEDDPAAVSAGPRRYWPAAEDSILVPERLRPVAGLRHPDGVADADYLVIAPEAFIPALGALVELRESQGLDLVIEELQGIYDQFGDGRPEPESLRAYIRWVYGQDASPPLYLLLVGDGTADPKRYHAGSQPTVLPPYLLGTDPWSGEVAADNRYADVDGPEDGLPDMLVGRLPVTTVEQLEALVAKMVAYETQLAHSRLAGQALLVADDADNAGDFPALSAEVRAVIPSDWRPQSFYYSPDTAPDTFRGQVQRALQDGPGLVVYTGHGSVHQWAAENFLHLDDTPRLQSEVLPVVLELTCFTGAFQTPAFPSLDEGLLLQPGGAAAVWGPAGLGLASGHVLLAQGFIQSFLGDPTRSIGEAALAGKLQLLGAEPGFPDLLDSFGLLGDPATRLGPQQGTHPLFLPVMQR